MPEPQTLLPIYERRISPDTLVAEALISSQWLPALSSLHLDHWFIGDRRFSFPVLQRSFRGQSSTGNQTSIHFTLHRTLYCFRIATQNSYPIPHSLQDLLTLNSSILESISLGNPAPIIRPNQPTIFNYLDDNIVTGTSRPSSTLQRPSRGLATPRSVPSEVSILAESALFQPLDDDLSRPGDTQEDLDLRANMHQHEKDWIGDILSKSAQAEPSLIDQARTLLASQNLDQKDGEL